MAKTTANLTLDQIESVYSGKDGKCCCGCAGKHSSDVRNKARILRLVQEGERCGEVEFGETYAARVIGTRLYIVYIAEAV